MRGRAPTLRDLVLGYLELHGELTADEIAADLGYSVLSIRPRVTELGALGLIYDTGITRKNASGRPAIVWKATAAATAIATA